MSQERTSPSRVTRVQEKEELAELNDRFLQYIEQVRSMKTDNFRLETEIFELKERLGSEAESIKAMYEAELADARNLIDETAKEKARQQIIASKNASRVEELEAELKEVRDALERMETKFNAAERNANSLDAQRKSAIVEKNKYQKQVKELEAELAELRESCDSLKSNLEAETLSKVDLQNHIQSLKEELAFRKKVYEEELAGYKEKRSVFITEQWGDTEFQAELNKRVEIAIDELREDSDAKIEAYKDQLEAAYKDQIAALNRQIERSDFSMVQLKLELEKYRSSRSDQDGEMVKLRKKIEKLETTIRDLKDELDRCRRQHSDEMARRAEELRLLRESYEVKIREYEELMDVKVQLDQEIATYRVLLTGEETRLNLTPTPREKRTRSHTQTTESASKRARLDTSQTQSQKTSASSNATGRIQITEVDTEGRYIEIKNICDDVEPIGGLKIQHEVEGGAEVSFRFHNKSKLQGGACVKVWSGDAEGAVHNPPTDLVWRNQSWGTGRKTLTKLIKGGEEIAQFRQSIEASPCKSSEDVDTDTGIGTATGSLDSSVGSFPHLPDTEVDSSAGGSSRTTTRVTKHYTMTTRSGARQQREQQAGGEHVFHQRGDPEPAGEKSCVIS